MNRHKKVTVSCRQCGKEWSKALAHDPHWSGYCKSCAAKNRHRVVPAIKVTCQKCGKTKILPKNIVSIWSGLCKACQSRETVTVTCKECGKLWQKNKRTLSIWQGRCRSCAQKHEKNQPEIKTKNAERAREWVLAHGGIPNRQLFTTERMSGSNHPGWKGGITPEAMRIRNSKEYQKWRTAVFQRDNFTCIECGKRGGILNADHILPFAQYPELRLDVSNGRTLCRSCHRKRHTKGQQ